MDLLTIRVHFFSTIFGSFLEQPRLLACLSPRQADLNTGHWPGWLPVSDAPEDRWHREAFKPTLPNGTYELVGPKVQGNPYQLKNHELWWHGSESIEAPRSYEELKKWFEIHKIEGIVWHHPDGRLVKIKRKDFGYKWPDEKTVADAAKSGKRT